MAMALRPIDNALPATPERPKKPTKVAAVLPTQKKPDSCVNNENKASVEVVAPEASIDYVSSENLKPISDPDSMILGLVEGLESKDWIKVCESLNDARRFVLFHSDLLVPILEKVMVVVVKSMKNPRSALIKTSIMASADIFNAFGGSLLESTTSEAFNQLLLQLLLKASQDKRFVCEEADKALSAMVKSLTPLPLLNRLKAYVTHAHLKVRAKAAISISTCVSKMGLEGMKEYGLVALVKMGANSLNDRLPEAREAARSIVTSVYNAYTEKEEEKQEAWTSFCESNLTPIQAHAMIKFTSSQ